MSTATAPGLVTTALDYIETAGKNAVVVHGAGSTMWSNMVKALHQRAIEEPSNTRWEICNYLRTEMYNTMKDTPEGREAYDRSTVRVNISSVTRAYENGIDLLNGNGSVRGKSAVEIETREKVSKRVTELETPYTKGMRALEKSMGCFRELIAVDVDKNSSDVGIMLLKYKQAADEAAEAWEERKVDAIDENSE